MEETKKKAKKPMKKTKSNRKIIPAFLVFSFLFVEGLVMLATGSNGEEEPSSATWKTILNGQYMEEWGTSLTENTAGKNGFQAVSSSLETILGKRESNGVYKGKDHQLFEKIEQMDEAAVTKNTEAINEFSSTHYNLSTYVMLVPDAANVHSQALPASVVTEDQSAQFEKLREMLDANITWIDVEKTLKEHENEKIYYDTDEHWTTLGAFYGYETFVNALDQDTSDIPKLRSYVVTNDFNGSLAKKSGYEDSYTESISIYSAEDVKDNTSLRMTNTDTGEISASLYDVSGLEKEDKYSLFPAADTGFLDIETTVDHSQRLLLIKDSFANCLIPFLTPHFREIVVIDPELYDGSIQELMQSKKMTHLLFLYSGNSFVTTESIEKILN